MIRLHARTLPVQRAERELGDRLWQHMVDHDLDYPTALLAATRYQEGLLRQMSGEPAPSGKVLGPLVDAFQEEHGLTDVELLRCLLAHQNTLARYMLRCERHPDDPDAKADEA